MINKELYEQAVEIIQDDDDYVVIEDLGIIVNGTEVDTLAVETWGLVPKIKFYAGNPFDGGYYEQIELTDEQINGVLDQFVELY